MKIILIIKNKKCLCNLIGCAVFLCVGTCDRKAKAVDFPDVETLQAHWKQRELVYAAFDALYPQAGRLTLLSDKLPGAKTKKQTPSFKMYFSGEESPFETASDLDQLSCDACLKKICRVLCSSEFLAAVLLKKTVDVLRTEAEATTIAISPLKSKSFFDKYKKGKLSMCIKRDTGKFSVRFEFLFQKAGNDVSLQAIRIDCELPSVNVKYHDSAHRTPKPLTDFPYDDLLQAPKNLMKIDRFPEPDFHTFFVVKMFFPDVSVKWSEKPSSFDKKTKEKLLLCDRKLRSEDFFKEIFGERVLKIFEYECSMSIYKQGLYVGYDIVPLCGKESLCDPVDKLDIRLWLMDATDDKILPYGPDRLYGRCLNIISDLHFVLDIGKNKIYDAEFRGNLKLNGRIFMNNGHYHDSRPIEERDTIVSD